MAISRLHLLLLRHLTYDAWQTAEDLKQASKTDARVDSVFRSLSRLQGELLVISRRKQQPGRAEKEWSLTDTGLAARMDLIGR